MRIKWHIPSLLITIICVICFCLPIKVGFNHSPGIGSILYHIFHANVFHLAVNIIALWQFKPRPFTCLVAFICATLASVLPIASVSETTYGLSAFLFAAYARKFVSWKLNPINLIIVNTICIFIPHLNWRIHLLAFFFSYIFWYGYYNYTGNKRKFTTL